MITSVHFPPTVISLHYRLMAGTEYVHALNAPCEIMRHEIMRHMVAATRSGAQAEALAKKRM
ncbi:hypothetical protein CUU80_00540 [Bifidobacterium scaligerum]|uniref:Uncharacterized protein n=1 Tax=Bifidobacterium scaligerum TaxID=2052656 RepID=A0A2M9HSB2_9BIFI|nr:hypothetical protein CUU80_00540 [Bifidobacterium scaligerum]